MEHEMIDKETSAIAGAIVGDIIGSRFEHNNYRGKDIELFSSDSTFTDETVIALGTAHGIMEYRNAMEHERTKEMLPLFIAEGIRYLAKLYPHCRYESRFARWVFSRNIKRPYHSESNNALVRVAPCIDMAGSMNEALNTAHCATIITHNSLQAMHCADYLVHMSYDSNPRYRYTYAIKDDKHFITQYEFTDRCNETMQAIEFICNEENDFEQAMRIAISVGGDSDTIASCVGIVCAKRIGIPGYMIDEMENRIKPFKSLWNVYQQCFS